MKNQQHGRAKVPTPGLCNARAAPPSVTAIRFRTYSALKIQWPGSSSPLLLLLAQVHSDELVSACSALQSTPQCTSARRRRSACSSCRCPAALLAERAVMVGAAASPPPLRGCGAIARSAMCSSNGTWQAGRQAGRRRAFRVVSGYDFNAAGRGSMTDGRTKKDGQTGGRTD